MPNKSFLNNLYDRQLNDNFSLNKKYYSDKIVKSYYDSSEYLYKHEITSPGKYYGVFTQTLKFSKCGNFMVSGDQFRVYFWNINESPYFLAEPNRMKYKNIGFIEIVAFTEDSSKIFSYGDVAKNLYHFVINDTATGEVIKTVNVYDDLIDILNWPSNPNLVTIANKKNDLFTYDLRTSNLEKINSSKLRYEYHLNSIQHHPIQDHLLLVASDAEKGVYNYDLRNNQIVFNYNFFYTHNSDTLSAKYNSKGNQILVRRLQHCPLIFKENENYPSIEFDDFGYHNSDYTKNCCFAGPNDEYVVAGSDNFNIFMWEIPDKTTRLKFEKINTVKRISTAKYILKGHRSNINCIDYNYSKSILASCGKDDKIIFYSPFSFYSKTNFDKTKFSNDTSHERNLIYLGLNSTYGDNQNILSIISDYTYIMFLNDGGLINYFLKKYSIDFGSKNYFCSDFEITYDCENLELEFKKNLNICYIKSFIDNYKIDKSYRYLDLLKKIENVLKEKLESGTKNIHIQHVSLLFEVNKLFRVKNFIKKSINYLEKHSFKINETIKKLVYDNDLVAVKKLILVKKIRFKIDKMVLELINIIKINKKLFESSFQVMKKLLERFDDTNTLDSLKPELLDDILIRPKYLDEKDNKNYCLCKDFKKNKLKHYLDDNFEEFKKKFKKDFVC